MNPNPLRRPGRPGRGKRARGISPPSCFKVPWSSWLSFWLFPELPGTPATSWRKALEKALQMFGVMVHYKVESSVVTINAAISAYEKGNEWEKALHLLSVTIQSRPIISRPHLKQVWYQKTGLKPRESNQEFTSKQLNMSIPNLLQVLFCHFKPALWWALLQGP